MALDREALVPMICKRLATGEPLAVICRDLGIGRRTVQLWRKDDPAIDEQMQEARDDGYDAIAARVRETARGRGDSADDVQRDKLIVDTDLKLLAKWDPKRYGDKIDVNHGGQKNNPIMALIAEVSGKTFGPVQDDDGS